MCGEDDVRHSSAAPAVACICYADQPPRAQVHAGETASLCYNRSGPTPRHSKAYPTGVAMANLLDRITIDPDICHGKPCVRGLRYPVATILELLSSGVSVEELLADYEDLEREDILAVFDFAARLVQVKRFQPFIV